MSIAVDRTSPGVRVAAARCSVWNVLDRVGTAAFRALCWSGVGYVQMPYDARQLDADLRLRSEARRDCRRLERLLACSQ